MEEMTREWNKEKKLQKITAAAYDLFAEKGIDNTTIDNIVQKAGIAKGTFYLYFSDKGQLVEEIVFKKSSILLQKVMDETEKKRKAENLIFSDVIIYFVDCLINELRSNKILLKIIHKSLSWGLYEQMEKKPIVSEGVCRLMELCPEKDRQIVEKRIYIVVEMINAVCYNAIILNVPCSIEEIKSELFYIIRKIIE